MLVCVSFLKVDLNIRIGVIEFLVGFEEIEK